MTAGERRFVAQALENRFNREILARLGALGLAEACLVSGCLAQTVWNLRAGRAPEADIKDYDVFYFDGGDLSWEAEDAVIRRAAALFADLGVTVELRNQARVHLWYRRRFGGDYPRLASARDGIDRFLSPATAVGLGRCGGGGFALYAPYGLDDLYEGVLRPNPVNLQPQRFREKMESYRARWPWLRIVAARDE